MRRLAVSPPSKGGRSASPATIPPPVGGWNARDPFDSMPPTDAIKLTNWFPGPNAVAVRKGSQLFGNLGHAVPVSSLMPYNGPTKALFAACNGGFFKLTPGGTLTGPAPTGLSNSAWESVNFVTSGGTFLVAVNGTDVGRLYDGTSWQTYDDASTPAVTGTTTDNFSNVTVFKRFLFFVEKASMTFWFLDAGLVGGTLNEFPLGITLKKGGFLVAIADWTIDGGNGPEDYCVFITSEGEVVIYSGTDPSSADTWSWVGTFEIGRPLGKRCFLKYGGDLLVLTSDGLYPLSQVVQSKLVDKSLTVSLKISQAFSDAAAAGEALAGWCGVVFRTESVLLVNVPKDTGGFNPYVMNTQTKAWCDVKDWDCVSWCEFDRRLFFGTSDGLVLQAFVGASDYRDGAQNPIIAEAWAAFNYFGAAIRGNLKECTLVKPTFTANGGFNYELALAVDLRNDFDYVELEGSDASPGRLGSFILGTDVLSGDLQAFGEWQSCINDEFYSAGIRLRLSLNGTTLTWGPTQYLLKLGGLR